MLGIRLSITLSDKYSVVGLCAIISSSLESNLNICVLTVEFSCCWVLTVSKEKIVFSCTCCNTCCNLNYILLIIAPFFIFIWFFLHLCKIGCVAFDFIRINQIKLNRIDFTFTFQLTEVGSNCVEENSLGRNSSSPQIVQPTRFYFLNFLKPTRSNN